MGQKTHPIGFRLGIIRDWDACWYGRNREYADKLVQDMKIRGMVKSRLASAAVSRIVIERPADNINVNVHTARPGIVIGKRGEDIAKLKADIERVIKLPVQVAVTEIRRPEMDATLVAENVAQQLEKRIMFRRAMRRSVQNAMRLGAKGVKITVAGRLNGAEIARTEWHREGRVPLHTLRADVDYGVATAKTTYGVIGIKVWIYKGEKFGIAAEPETAKSGAAGSKR
ncbi:MAG TPA: 30S ribosomal protein S3 [Gammaproteobacteria bacterium]|nr:30S ribosomal protein S3 [Gammaproteobacteria bacterium]